MTKDEIVAEVLEAIAKELDQNEWPNAAAVLRGEMRRELHAKVRAALAPIAERMAAESRELDEPTSEKARRVYYQDIVYSVCSVLDEIDGRKAGSGIICGTAEAPSTEVQDRMKRLLAEWRNRATTTEPAPPSLEYVKYRRTQIAEMVDWYDGFDMSGVSVSQVDRTTGSPKAGDKIARNPDNHDDKWLVAKAYFDKNFAAISSEVHTTAKPSLEAALAVVREAVQRTSASAIIVCQNGYRVGDGAYEAAWRVAEKLNQLARERHSEEISARQADVDAARKALTEAEAELAKVKGGGA